jgi:hypothetical protein
MIEKPRRLRRKPRFLYRTCEGSHLTHLCHVTVEIPEAWGSPKGPSGSEESMVSQHFVPSLVDTKVMPMQSSTDTPFPLGVDAFIDLVVSHPVPLVIVSMQSLNEISPMFGEMCLLTLLSSILFNQRSCRCNLRLTTLLFFGVMHLLTLWSHILFNLWLRKWSCRCNLRLTPLFSWRVTILRKRSRNCKFWSITLFWFGFYTFYAMSLTFLVLQLLKKRYFYSSRVLSLQVLMRFPLIGIVL